MFSTLPTFISHPKQSLLDYYTVEVDQQTSVSATEYTIGLTDLNWTFKVEN